MCVSLWGARHTNLRVFVWVWNDILMPRYIFIIVAVLLPLLAPLESWCMVEGGERGWRNAQGMGCEMRTGSWSSSQETSYVLWQHVKPIYFDIKHINLYLIHFVLRSSPLCFVYTQTKLNKKVWSHFLGFETQHQHPMFFGLIWWYAVVSLVGSDWLEIPYLPKPSDFENIRYPMKDILKYI